MAYTATETPVLLASLNTRRSTDCTALLNKGMLLGTSICGGKLSDHLIQLFRRKVGISLSQANFELQVCLYMSLHIVIGEIIPRGSKMDANSSNTLRFVFPFTVVFKFTLKVSFFLSYATPKILECDTFVPSSSFA